MKILVCGGRNFGKFPFKASPDYDLREKEYFWMLNKLDELAEEFSAFYDPDDNWLPSDFEIITGGATGADTAALDWAAVRHLKTYVFYPDWANKGRAAGIIRNIEMLHESQPDLVVGFPGGAGTTHMIGLARSSGVPVRTFSFDRS